MSQKKDICQATPVDMSRNSRTIAGDAVSYAPQSTPKPSTTRRKGRKQIDILGMESRRGHWSTSTGGDQRRSPLDRRRVIRRCWRGRPTE